MGATVPNMDLSVVSYIVPEAQPSLFKSVELAMRKDCCGRLEKLRTGNTSTDLLHHPHVSKIIVVHRLHRAGLLGELQKNRT